MYYWYALDQSVSFWKGERLHDFQLIRRSEEIFARKAIIFLFDLGEFIVHGTMIHVVMHFETFLLWMNFK